ncbi:mechanosensitive ion channel protein 2, chloroplastic-like isoform X1 [Oryza brachyantha]|uniref:mechanosensitive ion channel protein 2, chloroplastic-like isoform X1 n=2 Tax=Oryza brachyantha TaxID=4533 RepID=UPI001ADBCE5D|nr:mechanosensitive ion channel protein 2, chloroplastic-like isoform X1 [Oryza brachyantha]XP_040384605.1 mechanosensitive ion channel protein 2, chloroplastic-like isoform X1 [Oryza brachyantha]XP_040384606.1 mechanosensitive ion channel protein 2, chloroplastic-like isoform X1 [Oryza brachyantha]
MAVGVTSQLFQQVTASNRFCQTNKFRNPEMRSSLASTSLYTVRNGQDCWGHNILDRNYRPMLYGPSRYRALGVRSFALPVSLQEIPLVKSTSVALTRSCDTLLANPATALVVPAIGIIVFALWGFLPLMRDIRNRFDHGGNWKKSPTYLISSSYLQPLLLWTGATLICRALDPVVLPSAASQAVKTRLVTFVRSLSTVLAIAYILTSLIQQLQKFLVDMRNPNDSRNMGFDFTLKAVYTGIWIAAISLFMELLGFNTQKWITAGGFGTVLLTLAGREIFTNFLSSVMINATRPFVVNEWINTKIDGVEVSGIVEHVGWWSPTIIRGDDREAIYIPNHKFTVSILRNNTQRTHWRIKTYLALSHMDAAKVGIIVADMRKVLAKNPNIEQQRLHRRVFFEKIDPKTQALMIYISCFVKTSRFEEYLNVQEAVMLDLLRIVGHHKARLATQIRTVQKSYGNADIDNIPFGEEMYSRVRGRPLLIDTSARISDDKSKPHPASREEHKVKTVASTETKPASPDNASISNNSEKQEQKKSVAEDGHVKNSKNDQVTTSPWSENMDNVASTSKTGKGKTQGPEATERGDGSVSVANSKKETRPVFEDNIVLGLALDGSKRTLPIDDGTNPHLSLSETEQDTVEAASSPKDKKVQEKADQRNP